MQERTGKKSAVAVVVGTALLLLYCGFFQFNFNFLVWLLCCWSASYCGLFAFKCFLSSVEKPTGADTYPAKLTVFLT